MAQLQVQQVSLTLVMLARLAKDALRWAEHNGHPHGPEELDRMIAQEMAEGGVFDFGDGTQFVDGDGEVTDEAVQAVWIARREIAEEERLK